MSIRKPVKAILATTLITASILSAAFTSSDRKNHGVSTGNNKAIIIFATVPADTTAWIDSLKKVITKKFTWGGGGLAVMNTQKRYIRANTTLADYYARKFYGGDYASLAPAEKYYGNVAFLTSGTDGDLADDVSVLQLRDEGAKKLLRLYLSLKPSSAYRAKLYKLLRANPGVLRNESTATRDKVSKFIFSSTNRFFFDMVPGPSASADEISCYVNPVYPLSSKAGPGKLSLLDSFATIMKANQERRLKVASHSSLFTMMEQQLMWEISNFVISYLVDKQGIASDRFLFSYNFDDKATAPYKGLNNMPMLTLGFAAEGEEGPSMVPPPLPNLKH